MKHRKRGRENGRYVRAQSEEGVTLIPEWERKSYALKRARAHMHTHTSGPSSFCAVSKFKKINMPIHTEVVYPQKVPLHLI